MFAKGKKDSPDMQGRWHLLMLIFSFYAFDTECIKKFVCTYKLVIPGWFVCHSTPPVTRSATMPRLLSIFRLAQLIFEMMLTIYNQPVNLTVPLWIVWSKVKNLFLIILILLIFKRCNDLWLIGEKLDSCNWDKLQQLLQLATNYDSNTCTCSKAYSACSIKKIIL